MEAIWRQVAAAELGFTLRVNGLCHRAFVLTVFRIVSRLGDGVLWYTALGFLLLVGGERAVAPVLQTGLTALCGVSVYRFLKERLVRERPFIAHGGISCGAPPLDRYSFPSGHTLHAALFSVFFLSYLPWLGIALLPFALLVAASRIVLGLHYPSDVVAGAVIGALLALASLALVSFPAVGG